MICFEDAFEIIVNEFRSIERKIESVALESSVGRISAEDYYSDIPLPQFDNSSMDGIAIRYASGINEWKILGEISAGKYKGFPADDNSAVYITTGAKLPPKFDTVIPVEDIELDDSVAKLRSGKKVRKCQFARKLGEDMSSGTLILGQNSNIKTQHIPLLASCGNANLKVLTKPAAAILLTGDELTDINVIPDDDKIRCSNLYSVLAAASRHFECLSAGIIKDDKEELNSRIAEMLSSDAQLIITTGGVSAGKYDYLPNVLKELGAEILFSGVNIKPGKPMTFAVFKQNGIKKLIFSLPGNPVSTYVTFILFVYLTYISAITSGKIEFSSAFLSEGIKKQDGKKHFLRGILRTENGKNFVSLSGTQSSADLYGLSLSNCIIVIDEDTTNPKQGDIVKCIII